LEYSLLTSLPLLQTEFAATLYEDIACMCYDLIDYKRQYHNYLENMKLLQVPIAVPHGGAAVAGEYDILLKTTSVELWKHRLAD
jgi:hypothetical protein